ncbi:MAG: hypothetical protein RL226_1265, partial [Bacteroidota bacterium]
IEKIVARLSIGSNANDRSPDPYIQFEEAPKILGIEFLGPILRCIQHHQEMAFAYKKYTDDAGDESKTVQPYLLKEYRNRWYLIAFDKDKLDYRTYGLDRMIQVNPLDLFFTPDPSFNPDTFFRHSIGITQIDTTPSNIEFECSPLLAKYLESQPIHQSQKIQFSEMGTHRVQLHVLITYELISILRSYGSDVKIIAPDSLRTRVINDLKITLKNYSTT